MTDKIINTLKIKLVAAELAKMGITDRAKVIAVAERTMVDDNGAIIGLKADGNRGVGSAPSYELSIADVVADMGETATATPDRTDAASRVVLDPTAPGFNLSRALVAARDDEHLRAELLDRLAPRPLRVI